VASIHHLADLRGVLYRENVLSRSAVFFLYHRLFAGLPFFLFMCVYLQCVARSPPLSFPEQSMEEFVLTTTRSAFAFFPVATKNTFWGAEIFPTLSAAVTPRVSNSAALSLFVCHVHSPNPSQPLPSHPFSFPPVLRTVT